MAKSEDDLAATHIHGGNIDFDIEVKCQGHTEVIDIRDTSSHMPNMVCLCQRTKNVAGTQSHVINSIILTLRLKDNVVSGS